MNLSAFNLLPSNSVGGLPSSLPPPPLPPVLAPPGEAPPPLPSPPPGRPLPPGGLPPPPRLAGFVKKLVIPPELPVHIMDSHGLCN